MTIRQMQIARRTLGLPNREMKAYPGRIHVVAGIGHPDFEEWMQMVADGNAAMSYYKSGLHDPNFWMTEQGVMEALCTGETIDPANANAGPPIGRIECLCRFETHPDCPLHGLLSKIKQPWWAERIAELELEILRFESSLSDGEHKDRTILALEEKLKRATKRLETASAFVEQMREALKKQG